MALRTRHSPLWSRPSVAGPGWSNGRSCYLHTLHTFSFSLHVIPVRRCLQSCLEWFAGYASPGSKWRPHSAGWAKGSPFLVPTKVLCELSATLDVTAAFYTTEMVRHFQGHRATEMVRHFQYSQPGLSAPNITSIPFCEAASVFEEKKKVSQRNFLGLMDWTSMYVLNEGPLR